MKLCRVILIVSASIGLMFANTKTECGNTVCFSQADCNAQFSYAVLVDNVKLCGGKCQGKTIPEMNASGWNVIQVTELAGSFGVLLEKKCKKK